MLIVRPRVLGAIPDTLCVRRRLRQPRDPISRRWTWAAEPAFLDDRGIRAMEKTGILPGAAGTTLLYAFRHSGRFCFLAANASARLGPRIAGSWSPVPWPEPAG